MLCGGFFRKDPPQSYQGEDGAAYVLEEGKVTRYTPVPPEEFCGNKIDRLKEIKDKVLSQLPALKNDAEGYITIKGELEIINKLKNTVRQAEARIYVSANRRVMELLRKELQDALARGLKVVIISDEKFTLPEAICYGTDKQTEQIRLKQPVFFRPSAGSNFAFIRSSTDISRISANLGIVCVSG